MWTNFILEVRVIAKLNIWHLNYVSIQPAFAFESIYSHHTTLGTTANLFDQHGGRYCGRFQAEQFIQVQADLFT